VDCEWDPQKAVVNLKMHGVDFADAVGAFDGPLALTVADDSQVVSVTTFFSPALLLRQCGPPPLASSTSHSGSTSRSFENRQTSPRLNWRIGWD
jgi:hypothetical protein